MRKRPEKGQEPQNGPQQGPRQGGKPGPKQGPKQGPQDGPPRWRKAQREIEALRARVARLEAEVQECRQLNKRLAEVTDVVAEVLLPAEQRDEERLRALLANYERTL
jgi:DNA repair exonuclease SbcCD ATPase subunit